MATTTLVTRCPVCKITSKLRKCQGRHVVSYCGPDHQASDWKLHKVKCNSIRKLHASLRREEEKLRLLPGDLETDPAWGIANNMFEHAKGRFWEVEETRLYMKFRHGLVQELLEVKTVEAVWEAFFHCMNMLQHDPEDHIGVFRMFVPLQIRFLYMRGKRVDQLCYDSLTWYMIRRFTVLLDIKSLQTAAVLNKRLPPEIVELVRRQLVGPLVLSKKDIMESQDLNSIIKNLEQQIQILYEYVERRDPEIWSELAKPQWDVPVSREYFDDHEWLSEEDPETIIRYNHGLWAETPGRSKL
ncbi:hypothetical protein LTR10_023885 [Elasticomyces elasticus]|nr:hypothetical protein LTR10_023885 [Elasticomyces elasticus]